MEVELEYKVRFFKTIYALHWGSEIWEPKGTIEPFSLGTGVLPYNVTLFEIFVTEQDSF